MKFFDKIVNAKLEEKYFKKVIFYTALAIIVFLVLAFLNFGIILNYTPDKNADTVNDGKVAYDIEDVIVSRKYIEIKGWAYKKQRNIGHFVNRFVIQNEETGKYKVLKTGMQIKEEFLPIDGEFDCRRAGMYAKGFALGLKKGTYKIFIEYKNDGENLLVDTEKTFTYGK